jgi:glycosyltransferase involved in cell wall biosynthesis
MLYKVHPQWVGTPRRAFWRVFVPLGARRCRRIVTISENSKRDIVRFLGVRPEKVVVTPLAADSEFATVLDRSAPEVQNVTRDYGLEDPYLLNVGGMGRHKNTMTLVKAFHQYNQTPGAPRLTLVLAGRDYGSKRDIASLVAGLDLAHRVRFLDYVPRRDLPALYRAAHLYVSVSFLEGFGLTPLEAMSCGTPVIVSQGGALPEVVGGAGIIIEPTDVNGLAAAILRIAKDDQLRNRLSHEGMARAKAFSWKQTARQTLHAYQAAAGA